MKIATWNVNSIIQRTEHLKDFLKKEQIDVMMLQETKCTDQNFPSKDFIDLGYNCIFSGQKAYNGVAILSKYQVVKTDFDLMGDEQKRYIECTLKTNKGVELRLINIYAPHGQSPELARFQYKMQFLENLKNRILDLLHDDKIVLVGGDYNVAPENIDVYDHQELEGSMGFHIKERQKFRQLVNNNLFDLFRLKNPDKKEFSWWDYRSFGFVYNRGMRIDHILGSCQIVDALKDCYIAKYTRGLEKPSDHAPVVCVIDL